MDNGFEALPPEVRTESEIRLKYDGYIARQKADARRFERTEDMPLPANIDYNSISGLRLEARQKLSAVRPQSIGQASRISGVSPADISVLLIWLKLNKGKV